MSDTSREQLRRLKESTWGQVPASAMTNTRMTSNGLKYNIGSETSDEIRSDRQTSDLIQTTFDASGPVNFELSYGTYDDFFESMMFSAFSTAVNISATDISAANSDNSFNSTTTDFTAQNISVGQWIKTAGFTNSANNGYFKVTSVATNKIIVSNGTLTTESAGNTITAKGSMIRNGTTMTSFTLEREFSDITQFITYYGMVVNTFNLNIQSQAKVTGDFNFSGKNATIQGTTQGTGAPNAASTTQIMSVGSHVKNVRENGASLGSVYVKQISLALNNNIRTKDAVGQIGAVGVSPGSFNLTGKLVAYFENENLYNKFINNTNSSIDFRLEDAAGNAYIFTTPNLKYSDGDIPNPGNNEFGVVDLSFESILDTSAKMFQIDRFPV